MAGTIRIQERLRGLLYTPFYAMLALKVPEQEGIALEFIETPGSMQSGDMVLAGAADMLWGGPMRVMWARERDPACELVCLCEVVTRDPFTLMGRFDKPDFRLADLMGRRLALVKEVETPWFCLQEDLRRAGLDLGQLVLAPRQSLSQNIEAFRRGEIDVLQTFEPFVEELLETGDGAVWYAAADRGATAYTSLYAHRSFLETRRDDVVRLVRAMYRTQRWLVTSDPGDVARLVAPFFPDTPLGRLTGAIARYRDLGVWGTDPMLSKAGFERLRASIVSGGFVTAGSAFEVTVDNSFAEEVMATEATPLSIS